MDYKKLLQEAKMINEDIVAYRHDLHRIPELKSETVLTEKYIAARLTEIGAEDIRCGVGGHGVTAMIRGTGDGGCIAIRADCDGLPIREETGLPFASENGNMHACGHDAHTAMALGAAMLLMRHRDSFRGSVKLIFQPYEEGDGGAKLMLQDGVLEGVDEIIAQHIGNIMGEEYRSGDVVYPDVYASANIWAFRTVFHGKGSHVCTPQSAINPVLMASEAALAIQNEVAVRRENGQPVIAAVTKINAGVRNNIIPESCEIEGSIRAYNKALHRELCAQTESIMRRSAEKYGGTAETQVTIDLMSTENNASMQDGFLTMAGKMLPQERVIKQRKPVPNGEDFARFADVIPGFYFFLCSRPEGVCYPHHHPKFDIDESTLPIGAALLAGYVFERNGV